MYRTAMLTFYFFILALMLSFLFNKLIATSQRKIRRENTEWSQNIFALSKIDPLKSFLIKTEPKIAHVLWNTWFDATTLACGEWSEF